MKTMINRKRAVQIVLLAVLMPAFAARCGNAQSDPGATNEVFNQEIPGAHSPNDIASVTAHRWINDVRLEGALQPGHYRSGDTVLVSMRVSDAPAGSVVRVSIHDSGDHEVWKDDQSVTREEPRLSFLVSAGKLVAGSYEARVIVGDEVVARKTFEVTSGQA
jgi:hypothetical protein